MPKVQTSTGNDILHSTSQKRKSLPSAL